MLNFEAGNRLRAAAQRIAEATLARDYAQRPYLLDRYGENGRMRYREDVRYTIDALSAAIDADDAAMFLGYVGWLKVVLSCRHVALEDVAESLRCTAFALTETPDDHSLATSYLEAALQQLDAMPCAVASFLDPSKQEHSIAQRCLEALLRLDAGAAHDLLENALATGLPMARVYAGIFPPLMREIGRLWQMNEISVAHEHYCSAAVQSILSGFYDRLFSAAAPSTRSLLVACVEGEQHELGARTIADLFELRGWRTVFLGANLPPRELIALINRAPRKPDLIALSATLPRNLVKMGSTIAAIRDGTNIPIMLGGYVFDSSDGLADRMGADACADDAEAALAIADTLVDARG